MGKTHGKVGQMMGRKDRAARTPERVHYQRAVATIRRLGAQLCVQPPLEDFHLTRGEVEALLAALAEDTE